MAPTHRRADAALARIASGTRGDRASRHRLRNRARHAGACANVARGSPARPFLHPVWACVRGGYIDRVGVLVTSATPGPKCGPAGAFRGAMGGLGSARATRRGDVPFASSGGHSAPGRGGACRRGRGTTHRLPGRRLRPSCHEPAGAHAFRHRCSICGTAALATPPVAALFTSGIVLCREPDDTAPRALLEMPGFGLSGRNLNRGFCLQPGPWHGFGAQPWRRRDVAPGRPWRSAFDRRVRRHR